MTITTVSRWKMALDEAQDFLSACGVVNAALRGGRDERLTFLGELYREFADPSNPYAGEAGTLDWMGVLYYSVFPSEVELRAVGIDPPSLSAYLGHRG